MSIQGGRNPSPRHNISISKTRRAPSPSQLAALRASSSKTSYVPLILGVAALILAIIALVVALSRGQVPATNVAENPAPTEEVSDTPGTAEEGSDSAVPEIMATCDPASQADESSGSCNAEVTAPTLDASDIVDTDSDGIPDETDNCPDVSNPISESSASQTDSDGDNIGDACDDSDQDTNIDPIDNCPVDSNKDQADFNENGIGDACDNSDSDSHKDAADNCREIENEDQADFNENGMGDACDNSDQDTHLDLADNCPSTDNEDQADDDLDAIGNLCDDEVLTLQEVITVEMTSDVFAGGNPVDFSISLNQEIPSNSFSHAEILLIGADDPGTIDTQEIDCAQAGRKASTRPVWSDRSSPLQLRYCPASYVGEHQIAVRLLNETTPVKLDGSTTAAGGVFSFEVRPNTVETAIIASFQLNRPAQIEDQARCFAEPDFDTTSAPFTLTLTKPSITPEGSVNVKISAGGDFEVRVLKPSPTSSEGPRCEPVYRSDEPAASFEFDLMLGVEYTLLYSPSDSVRHAQSFTFESDGQSISVPLGIIIKASAEANVRSEPKDTPATVIKGMATGERAYAIERFDDGQIPYYRIESCSTSGETWVADSVVKTILGALPQNPTDFVSHCPSDAVAAPSMTVRLATNTPITNSNTSTATDTPSTNTSADEAGGQ